METKGSFLDAVGYGSARSEPDFRSAAPLRGQKRIGDQELLLLMLIT